MDMKLDKKKLKQLRESRAWSQSHLAEVCDVSLRTIQRIERTGSASPESIKSICSAYNIHASDILAGDDHRAETALPHSSGVRAKVSRMDVKATLIASIIAFAIAYIATSFW